MISSEIFLGLTSLFQSVKDDTSDIDMTKMQRYKCAAFYFLYPLDCLLPLAFSILRPLPLVKGLVWECGVPAAPKCLTASRAFLGPEQNWIFRKIAQFVESKEIRKKLEYLKIISFVKV